MPIERLMLGWDGPGLVKAAAWLRQQRVRAAGDTGADAAEPAAWDLSETVLVVPGGRAGRRLREVLVEQAGDAPLLPPRIITLGELPEALYEIESVTRIAGTLETQLAWVRVLHQADPDRLAVLLAHRPDDADLPDWLNLAAELAALRADLAGELLGFDDVASRLAAKLPDFADEERWRALGSLQRDYEALLQARQELDVHMARRHALHENVCQCRQHVVLIACADLNGLQRAMLRQASDHGTRITALVHAPAEQGEAFDALGGFLPGVWAQRHVPLRDEQWHVVDRPRDQACEVVRLLAEAGKLAVDQVTVGVGDESMLGAMERTLDLASVPVRAPVGRAVTQSRPMLMLAALGRFLGSRRFDDFAALLRHADVEQWLLDTLTDRTGVRQWLTLLDRYATDHLQGRLTGTWLGDAELQAQLKAVYEAVLSLLPDAQAQRSLPDWAQPMAAALHAVYGRRTLSRFEHADRQLVLALEAIGLALGELSELDRQDAATPHVEAAQAIAVLESMLVGQHLANEGGEPAVELLGWLELQLDDAPLLIVTGVNEGFIPRSVNADVLLPDHARRALGLFDNRRRYARDLLALTAILHSRPNVTLISGRRGASDDPLTPSRLMLACDEQLLPARVNRFYAGEDAPQPASAPLLQPGVSRFIVPPPQPRQQIIERLPVTAFRLYLACPYRFYLRYVLRLSGMDDQVTELGGDTFGGLAHDVLRDFGRSDLTDCTRPRDLANYLDAKLDEIVRQRMGDAPPAAVIIQREQLRARLRRLAIWQAQQVRDGWRILPEHVEASMEATLDVDGQPFTLTGRIDRIDQHETLGLRVIDYKTSDTARTPEAQHRTGPRDAREWVDLQLPLYRSLIAAAGLGGPVELGYMQLPKDLGQVDFAAAPWDDGQIAEAVETARDIIRAVRRQAFWKPGAPPPYEDDFTGICMDLCLDRTQAIRDGDALHVPGTEAAS